MGIAQYYLIRAELKRNINELAKTTKNPDELVQILKQQVLPQEGYTTSLKWKDLGKKLVEVGAIDKAKFEASVASDADGKNSMKYMDGSSDDNISISEKNSHFIVNFFWALGLANKSKVLDEGPMKTGNTQTANFASTGGWTLGAKPVMELYSSAEIVPLNSFQQDLVKKIAENVFRPCCGNSTAFPDCNHGMAMLGLLELLASQGATEEQMYTAALQMNRFWFAGQYAIIDQYLASKGRVPSEVSPKEILGKEYSSGSGFGRITNELKGEPQGGASCGV